MCDLEIEIHRRIALLMGEQTNCRSNYIREIDRHVVRRACAAEVEQTHRNALAAERFTTNQAEILTQIFERG